MTLIGFYILAALAAAAGAFLVTSRNLMHAVLALAVTSFAVAGLMLTLSAEFLAFVLVLVYVGAVVVLGLFAVMLTGYAERATVPSSREWVLLSALVSLALVALIAGVVLVQPLPAQGLPAVVSVRTLGELLLTEYVLPFELVSILLLAALIGGVVIARAKGEDRA